MYISFESISIITGQRVLLIIRNRVQLKLRPEKWKTAIIEQKTQQLLANQTSPIRGQPVS